MSSVIPSPSSRTRARNREHRDIIHKRSRIGFALLALGYFALAGRLVYIQVVRHHYYQVEANEIRQHTFISTAQRGSIFDRNGAPLAVNIQVGDVAADPTEIADFSLTARRLATIIPGFDTDKAQQLMQAARDKKTQSGKPVRFVIIAKAVPYEQVEAIKDEVQREVSSRSPKSAAVSDLVGIAIRPRSVRTYPNGDLAAQVVGFVNTGTAGQVGSQGIVGKYGIEKSFNAVLSGTDGQETDETDPQGRKIPGTQTDHHPAVAGKDVTLTIDSYIQRIAQDELEKSWSEHHAASGSVVVLDPSNGDILALATLPTYDPNKVTGTSNLQWHNGAVTDLYEPGSTMKTLTLSAVLDSKGLQHQYDKVVCTGQFQVGNHIIHCAKDPPLFGVHGVEDMRKVLENSCNIGAAQYALALGAPKLFEYEKRFGLLERPDTGLPGEQYCHLKGPDEKPWSKIQLANVAFGQGISMTPLQLASIYATIANNGVRVHPVVVEGREYQGPSEQAVKPKVAHAMLSMLQSVVEDGTGKPAQIAGYDIGGKTGSAQVAEHGHYGDQYVGSFCGVVPVGHPRLVILCAIYKPVGVHWGAVVAAPVVHNIAERALWYLKEPPDDTAKVDYADRNKKTAANTTQPAPRRAA